MPLDRLGLIRDAFALAESGDLPTVQALELPCVRERNGLYCLGRNPIRIGRCFKLAFGQKCYKNFNNFAANSQKNNKNRKLER